MYSPNFQVRKGLEGPAKDGETITLEQIETDDENDEVRGKCDCVQRFNHVSGGVRSLEIEGDEEVEERSRGG